ncbi:MAG: flagellar type III secretion system protein FlhB [Gammaproteobacteria bacterium]|nr:flagellar type III secretion system protein FlhB [Gammaproteobacteria bacterium]MBU1978350.1 flagellar type III secretion system protein FlhB [Gammaproteobacteria bacterium]
MAEDSDLEKTEPASSRRIEQAREKGQVARSRELSTFTVLIVAGAGLMVMGPQLMDSLAGVMRGGLMLDRVAAYDPLMMLARLHQLSLSALITFIPFILLMVVAAIFAPIVLSGWLFSFQALQPDFGKLSPLKGIGRLFSWTSLVELAKALGKTVLIGGVAYWAIMHHKEEMFSLAGESVNQSIAHLGSLLAVSFLTIVSSMILIVAIDVPFQLWDHSNKLKMTKEEVRKENKESEGSPEVKAQIRRVQREMARRRMMAEVPKADVIVTNPTHYAVALRYQDKLMGAPIIVAKGSALTALRIRTLGEEHHIPILEAPPLARALFSHGELGEEIPAALYTAVAEVLAYVYQLRSYETGGGVPPQPPRSLPVPPGLDPESKTA